MGNDIIFEKNRALAKIILNRPNALNALSGDMFLQFKTQLAIWENDPDIKAILVRSAVEKAFCAGGDIRAIYESRHQPLRIVSEYFRLEYEINRLISHCQKPYIALTHGITMGGGVGISLHGSHCVGAENLRWAMPETLIGFFPDVGVSYYFSRLAHSVGTYLALTGNTIDADTALQLGIIKKVIPRQQFDALEKMLTQENFSSHDNDAVTTIVNSFSVMPEKKSDLLTSENIEKIARCFSFNTTEEIIAALTQENSVFSQETLKQLLLRSPTSLKVTLRQLQLAKNKSFDEVIEMDFKIACTMLSNHDFFEGIRAVIVDKDKNPRWEPAALSAVTHEQIDQYFE